jgi:nucleoid-associated protein YgaU
VGTPSQLHREYGVFPSPDRHGLRDPKWKVTPTLWPNFSDLNASLGVKPFAPHAPYQQKWFPGDHGSVGGGGDIRGLSDRALSWILDGALAMGLEVDQDESSPLFSLAPDDFAPLKNMKPTPPSLLASVEGAFLTKHPRKDGPTRIEEVSDSAIRRWCEPADHLPENAPYRPPTLAGVAAALDATSLGHQMTAAPPGSALFESIKPTTDSLYKIRYGDSLRGLALKLYGHADLASAILSANRAITDPDRIYVGQVIYLPPVDPPANNLPNATT